MSDDANSLFSIQSQLESERSNWSSWWQDIAERTLPSQAQITHTNSEGEKHTERLFDTQAVQALEKFGAIMDELNTPRSQTYHELAPESDELADDTESKAHLERINRALFTERYRPRANFASQKSQNYLSLGAFGNSVMFIDEEVSEGPRYIACYMRDMFWRQTASGVVDQMYRKLQLQAAQAVQFFDRIPGAVLPTKIKEAARKSPLQKFDFLHCTRPNEERKHGRIDYRGMPWSSVYASYEDKTLVSVGGYQEWPYAVGRYTLGPNETYARSPAMGCWGAIQTINEEKKTVLRVGQKEADPPLLLTEEGCLEAFNLDPGALNYGAISNEGTALVQSLKSGANVPLAIELMGLESQAIEASFLVSIFQALVDNPQMTATQVLELVQQRATLLAPMMGRQQSEDLGPMIQRELGILSRMSKYAWISDEMPEQLRAANGSYKIEYTSPLARAMRAQDGVAIVRTLEMLGPAVQVDPDAALIMDVKGAYRELAAINGVPAKLIRDEKTVNRMLADKQAQEQAANVAAVAPEMAQAQLHTAQAEQIRRSI